jgi:hypothetical protein
MSKIHLTIEKSYRSNWGYEEGIRELLQNAKDAETEHGAKMVISHSGDTLSIANYGTVIDREALLLGNTSKMHRSDLIGQFGDGLKIGILALVRDGYAVKIRNGSELWVPIIEHSDKFNSEVLTFDIVGGRKNEIRVEFVIKGITAEMWGMMKKKFLFLYHPEQLKKIKTRTGELLLDQCHAGIIYVKGIYVQRVEGLSHGYNLTDANIDIERRVVDSYDRNIAIRSIWKVAITQSESLKNDFVSMMENSTCDFETVRDYNVSELGEDAINALVDSFKEKYGNDAVAVGSLEESREASHYGKRGVILTPSLLAVMNYKLGVFSRLKEKLRYTVKKQYSFSDIDKDDYARFEKAITLMSSICDKFVSNVEVVDFMDKNISGTCQGTKIQIASNQLTQLPNLMRVLVHEVAHQVTGAVDGERAHISEIERLWMCLFSKTN